MASAAAINFFTFHLLAMALLPILSLTFIIPCGVKRHATITNNLLVWACSDMAASLLLLSGNIDAELPPRTLCQAQSALVFGGSVARAATAFALVLHLWHLVWSVNRPRSLLGRGKVFFDILLVVTPWLMWILVAVITGLTDGNDVQRYSLYCSAKRKRSAIVTATFSTSFLLLFCIFQVWTFVLVSKRYRSSGRLGHNEIGHVSLDLFARIVLFSLITFSCFIMSIFAIVTGGWVADRPYIAVLASVIGPILFFLFGSQSDVLECWRLKRRKNHAAAPSSTHHVNDAGVVYNTTDNHLVNFGNDGHSRTIRIPLTLRALRSFASGSSQSGTDSKKGESTTSYGMDVLRTLNKNPTTKLHHDLPNSRAAGLSVSTQSVPPNPGNANQPDNKGGSSTSLPSTNSDGLSIGIKFNPPSIAEAPEDAVT